jgi:hypothetical protein
METTLPGSVVEHDRGTDVRRALVGAAARNRRPNQAYENMGLASTQLLGPVLDGLMRNTPEAHCFIELARCEGVGAAVARGDGPFGDYSQASA